jgi:hypothetical protein
MHVNEGYVVNIMPLMPQGTNSTMFTECCQVAICDNQAMCPRCKQKVIGWDETPESRRRIRWENATRCWERKKYR